MASDEAEQVWVWEYETEEGAHDLYMDIGEEIRFRVVDETFVDTSPTGPSSAEASTSSAAEEVQKKEAPYTLVVTMCINSYSLVSVVVYSVSKIASLSQGADCFKLTMKQSHKMKRVEKRRNVVGLLLWLLCFERFHWNASWLLVVSPGRLI